MIEQSLIDPYLAEIKNLNSTWRTTMDSSKALKQQADEIDRQIFNIQVKAVQAALKASGQNICSDFPASQFTPCNRFQGLFSIAELQYLFQDNGFYYTDGKYDHHQLKLRHLCPHHFPSNPNQLDRKHPTPNGILEFSSQVIERDGKYLTLIGHIDVTQIPILRHYPYEVINRFGIPARIGFSAYSTIAES